MSGLDSYIVLFVGGELCNGGFCFECEGSDPVLVFVAKIIFKAFIEQT